MYTPNDFKSMWEHTHIPVYKDPNGLHGGVNFLVPNVLGEKKIGFFSPIFIGTSDPGNSIALYSKDLGEGYALPKIEWTVDADNNIISMSSTSASYMVIEKVAYMYGRNMLYFLSDAFYLKMSTAYNNDDYLNWLGANRNYGSYDAVIYYDSNNNTETLSYDICAVIETDFDYWLGDNRYFPCVDVYTTTRATRGELPLNKFFYENIFSMRSGISETSALSQRTRGDLYPTILHTIRGKFYVAGSSATPYVAVSMPVFCAPMMEGTHSIKVQGIYICLSSIS